MPGKQTSRKVHTEISVWIQKKAQRKWFQDNGSSVRVAQNWIENYWGSKLPDGHIASGHVRDILKGARMYTPKMLSDMKRKQRGMSHPKIKRIPTQEGFRRKIKALEDRIIGIEYTISCLSNCLLQVSEATRSLKGKTPKR